jgi:hypothetical protein
VVLARMLQVHQRDQGGTGMGHGARALPISSARGVSRGWREGGSSCREGELADSSSFLRSALAEIEISDPHIIP